MLWFIGMIITKGENLIQQLKNKYILHSLAEHGDNCHLDGNNIITASNVHFGNNVFIGGGSTLLSTKAHIYIGDNVMFGPNVSIVTGNHRIDVIGKHMVDVIEKKPENDEDVIIEDDVWIGMGTTILKGVTVGRGSVIGAGTIVTKDIEPYSIVTNVQQLRKKKRFNDAEIELHEKMLLENINEK